MKIGIGIVLIVCMCSVTVAQRRGLPALPFTMQAVASPRGVLVVTSSTSPCAESDTLYTVVLRGTSASDAREVARVQRAETFADFTKVAGNAAVLALKEYRKLGNDDDVWKYITTHRLFAYYSSADVSPKLRLALGTAWLDESAKTLAAGTTVYYAVKYHLKNGKEIDGGNTSVVIGTPARLIPPQALTVMADDSVIRATFVAPRASQQTPFVARVFRSVDDSAFVEQNLFLNARVKNDTVYYALYDNVLPEKMYRYYIVPQDIAENMCANSDTASALSINFRRIPLLQNVTATDSPEGIEVRWSKLPVKPYWSGIEVTRRALNEQSYTVLDTIAWSDTSFTDVRVRSGAPYAYALRALTYRNLNDAPSGYANAVHQNNNQQPLPPNNVTATPEKRGIRITWNRLADADVRGYYVYRGLTAQELSVISKPITDTTYVDNDTLLYGRTTYVYVVRSVRYNEQESDNSNVCYARPNRPVIPAPPTGLTAYDEFGTVRLSWSESKTDRSVSEYHVYRRTATGKPINSTPAQQQGFTRLTKRPSVSLLFDDTTAERGKQYEYAISAVDVYGYESGVSSTITKGLTEPELKAPSTLFAHTVENGVELSWSTQAQESVKEIIVYRRTSTEQVAKRITTLPVTTRTFSDTNVQRGTIYIYSISVATTAGKESTRSKEKAIEVE